MVGEADRAAAAELYDRTCDPAWRLAMIMSCTETQAWAVLHRAYRHVLLDGDQHVLPRRASAVLSRVYLYAKRDCNPNAGAQERGARRSEGP